MTDLVLQALRAGARYWPPWQAGPGRWPTSRIRRRWTALHAALAAERGATHIIAEGSGHAVPLDRPVLVAETILGLTRALSPQ